MRFAKLIDNVIDVVVDCQNKPGPDLGEWVECGDAGPGWMNSNGSFSPPSTPRKDVIKARLAEIDRETSKPRTVRELQLNKTVTRAWVQTLDNEAEALRTELAGL